jgi:DNA-binding beta-propeller fold protein YncE
MKDDESVRSAIHRALDGLVRPAPELPARAFQRVRAERGTVGKSGLRRLGQAAGVLAAAALVAVAGIAIHQATFERNRQGEAPVATPNFVPPTSAAKGPGAAVAWLDNLSGFDASGHIVGHIPASVALRSPDGNAIYALAAEKVEVYSAITGKLERTIPRQGSGDTAAISPDGRFIAILGGTPVVLEVVDLASGRSVVTTRLNGALSNGLHFVLISADGTRIVAAGNFWQTSVVAVLHFDGSNLRVERQAVSGQQGHSLPSCDGMDPANAFGGLPERLLPDGNTMVSFCPGDGWVSWVDLTRLTITDRVHVQESNPFWLSPVFSTGSMLYVHEPGTRRVTSIDLVRRTIVRSSVVNATATTALDPLQWLADRLFPPALAGGIPRSAALSPDGSILYATSVFGNGVGVAAIDPRDLHVIRQWKLDGGGSLWLSGDGQAVFVTNQGGDRLSILHLGAGSVVTAALSPPGYDFLPIPN